MNYRLSSAAAVVACSVAASALAAAAPAEYAIRWDPSSGGPKTAAEALANLVSGEIDEDVFKIRYAVLNEPRPGIRAILRERIRTNKPRFELTYKLRSSSPLPQELAFTSAQCPAGAATESPKDEVDVSFSSKVEFTRAYSLSCTVESKKGSPAIPKALKAQLAPCASTTTRLKAGDLKVEEWRLPGGRIAIEVSRSGVDTDDDRRKFQDQVVAPLLDVHMIRPLKSSKTELGSDCGT